MGFAASLGADAMHATTANAATMQADLNFMVSTPQAFHSQWYFGLNSMGRRLTISARQPRAAYSQIAVFKTAGTFYKGFSLNHVSHQCGHHPMTFTLPTLPYAYDALAPHMSKETLEYHHDKHHQAYVTNGNNLLKGTEFEGKSLEEIVKGSFGKNAPLFNNAGQHYNHLHFWNWMKPNGGGSKLPGRLEKKITEDLGGLEKFKTDFAAAGVGQFGSGWAWLSVKNGKLEISKTPNGENPLVHGATPILGVDVWEHSYYIDYRNRRPDYLKAWIDHLVNWEYVDQLFSKA